MPLIVLLIVASLAVFPISAPESAAETALNAVVPQRETPPLFDDEAGGNADADDPAIWLHPQHPHLSLVIGTKKDGGLGVQACDGATAINIPLGFPFQAGLLVVHDGQNTPEGFDGEGEVRANTNFKFIRWGEVARAFDPPPLIDRHSWDPRQ